jgi:diguanylate cyclase (GGDEF)-like protein/PAS domain S-box-containing protein
VYAWRARAWSRSRSLPFVVTAAYLLIATVALVLHERIELVERHARHRQFENGLLIAIGAAAIYVIVRLTSRRLERSEAAARGSESRYHSLVTSIDDFVFTLDVEHRISGAFGRWLLRRRIDASTLIGKRLDEVLISDGPLHSEVIQSIVAGDSTTFECRTDVDGDVVYLSTTLSPIVDSVTGHTTGAVGVARDITEQRELDEALEETSELLDAVFRASPVGILTLDHVGRIQTVNPAAAAILRREPIQLYGEDLLPRGSMGNALLQQCAGDGLSFTNVDVRRRLDDGTYVELSVSAAPLNGRNNTARHVVAIANDVTMLREKESALRRYRLLAEHTRDVMLFVDEQGRVIEANDAASRQYGYSRVELVGLNISAICGDSEHPEPDCGLAAITASPRPVECVHRRRDGSVFFAELTATDAYFGREHVTLVLARDVSDRKRRLEVERLLHEIDRRILSREPIDVTLEYACSQLAQLYRLPLVQLSIKGESGDVAVRKGAGEKLDFLNHIRIRWDDTPAGRGPTGTAIRTGEMQWRELATDPDFLPWRDRALLFGLRDALAIPLSARGRVVGALTLFTREESAIDPESLNLLSMTADQLALSLLAAQDEEQISLQTVALESAANAIVVTEANGTIRWVNPAFVRLTGYTTEEALGAKPSILKSGNHSPAFYRQMWQTLHDGLVWHGELYNRRKDGSLYIEEQTITPVRNSLGVVTHFVAIKQDITARKTQEEQIRYLAMHDPLTDLPNRRSLEGTLERLCWDANHGREGALLIVDLDNLKPVNDTVGHVAGDRLLSEVAAVLRAALRPGDFLARMGGDEFAVILNQTAPWDALVVAERLRAAVSEQRFVFQGRVFDTSVSVGIAGVAGDLDPAAVLLRADTALYMAKEQGKNRVIAWSIDLHDSRGRVEASRIALEIREALREERFVLHYQPVVRLGNGQAEHYEALIRMIDRDGVTIPPDQFITAAERFGLMSQVDRWVVDKVIGVLGRVAHARIFVNLSGVSLNDATLLEFIEKRVIETGIEPGRLAFEITESVAVTDLSTAQGWIRRLKSLGCLFALDDFGVGFSSFSYLRALSADYVKIDRSFVTDLDTNPTNRALVLAVKTVAETLGKEVIAEGVETDAHAEVLRELGIHLAQGYRWGHPTPDTFAEVLPVLSSES